MPRPKSCPTHGADPALFRWRRNGTTPDGTPKRTRACVLCQPPRGASIQGRDSCPRCDSTEIVTVSGGRPGQAPYRACRVCRAHRNLRYRARSRPECYEDYDAGLALEIAMGGGL